MDAGRATGGVISGSNHGSIIAAVLPARRRLERARELVPGQAVRVAHPLARQRSVAEARSVPCTRRSARRTRARFRAVDPRLVHQPEDRVARAERDADPSLAHQPDADQAARVVARPRDDRARPESRGAPASTGDRSGDGPGRRDRRQPAREVGRRRVERRCPPVAATPGPSGSCPSRRPDRSARPAGQQRREERAHQMNAAGCARSRRDRACELADLRPGEPLEGARAGVLASAPAPPTASVISAHSALVLESIQIGDYRPRQHRRHLRGERLRRVERAEPAAARR